MRYALSLILSFVFSTDIVWAQTNMQDLSQLMTRLEQDPDNAQDHIALGHILRKSGYESLAQEHFQTANRLDPSIANAQLKEFQTAKNNPLQLIKKALAYRAQNNFKQSDLLLNQALKENPGYPGIATYIAFIRIEDRHFVEADALADHDLSLNQKHPAANLAKGKALLELGQAQAALPYLQTAFRSDKIEKKLPAESLSQAFFLCQRYGNALEPTLIAASFNDAKQNSELKTRLRLISEHVQPNQIFNTARASAQILSNSEQQTAVYINAASILAEKGQRIYGQYLYEEALKSNPGNKDILIALGDLQAERNNYQTAWQYYLQAHSLAPNDPAIRAKLERTEKRQQNKKQDVAARLKASILGYFPWSLTLNRKSNRSG
ncbi:MAG: tetratricopeptide repeat protein [Candidatus Obscuribacterales bacterium]|nr:tetratricopeptide repeat protein [Candidatus Obscuribacterales bacterium]